MDFCLQVCKKIHFGRLCYKVGIVGVGLAQTARAHNTQNTKHKTQNTKHKTQNTKHKTQNTKLKTQATSNQHELPLPILSNGFALYSHGNICHGPNSGLIVFPRVHARLTSAGFAALHSVPLFRAPMHTPSKNRAMGVGLALCGCRSIKKPNTQLIVGGSGRI